MDAAELMHMDYSTPMRPEPATRGDRRQPTTLLDIAWQTAFRLGFPLARIWRRIRAGGTKERLSRSMSVNHCSCSVHLTEQLGTFRAAAFGAERRRRQQPGANWRKRSVLLSVRRCAPRAWCPATGMGRRSTVFFFAVP